MVVLKGGGGLVCAGPVLLLSYFFYLLIEEPLGIRLPRKVVAVFCEQLDKHVTYTHSSSAETKSRFALGCEKLGQVPRNFHAFFFLFVVF